MTNVLSKTAFISLSASMSASVRSDGLPPPASSPLDDELIDQAAVDDLRGATFGIEDRTRFISGC